MEGAPWAPITPLITESSVTERELLPPQGSRVLHQALGEEAGARQTPGLKEVGSQSLQQAMGLEVLPRFLAKSPRHEQDSEAHFHGHTVQGRWGAGGQLWGQRAELNPG